MSLSRNLNEIVEYRGIEGLVCAEVLNDDADSYSCGNVFAIAGVAEISKSTDSSNEAHYYDNIPAVVVSNTSSDELTISVSAIPLEVMAEITGQYYDDTTASLVEGPRTPKYYAIGYKTKKTNGDEMYVWRYKGSFNIPDQTNHTEDDSTDANGQEIVYTGIATTHKFSKTGVGSKAMVVDVAKGLADVSTFFDSVTTPDTISTGAGTQFTLTITQAANTQINVTRNNTVLGNGAQITAGDILKISVAGGTITVNGASFTSGNTHTVASNVTVVSTAS